MYYSLAPELLALVHPCTLIEQRIRLLSSIFAIEICAYAAMSNHLHLVIKLNPEEASQWSAKEALERWRCLFKGSPIVRRHMAGEELSKAERDRAF